MKAVVTGGAGFIGSHLVNLLINLKYDVVVFDDLSTGHMANLTNAGKDGQLSCYVNRIGTEADSNLRLEIASADVVFHLAAVVGVHRVLERPLATITQNLAATASVLDLVRDYRVPTVIASSSEVYGRSLKPLLAEDDDLQIGSHPRWGYAAAKLVDEFTALALYYTHRTPIVVARIFNTIGPRQVGQYGMVVPRFIAQAMRNDPIKVYGNGEQRRSFTWVGDTVKALYDLSQCSNAYGQVVNIGTPNSTSILDLANVVIGITQSKSTIEFVTAAEAYGQTFMEIENRTPDITKIRRLIDFNPRTQVGDMISKIVKSLGVSV